MKKALLTLAVVCLMAGMWAIPSSANIWFADYRGYDYTYPNPGDIGGVGQVYEAVGPMVSFNGDYFLPDEVNYQYTVFVNPGTLTGTETIGSYEIYHYENQDGTLLIYEDPISTGTAYDYGSNPPNGVSPSTFVDGTLLFGAEVNSFTITIETTSMDGQFVGLLDFTSGSALGNIPTGQTDGWTIAALGQFLQNLVPSGYMNQMDGEIYLPIATSTEETSWGGIKALFE